MYRVILGSSGIYDSILMNTSKLKDLPKEYQESAMKLLEPFPETFATYGLDITICLTFEYHDLNSRDRRYIQEFEDTFGYAPKYGASVVVRTDEEVCYVKGTYPCILFGNHRPEYAGILGVDGDLLICNGSTQEIQEDISFWEKTLSYIASENIQLYTDQRDAWNAISQIRRESRTYLENLPKQIVDPIDDNDIKDYIMMEGWIPKIKPRIQSWIDTLPEGVEPFEKISRSKDMRMVRDEIWKDLVSYIESKSGSTMNPGKRQGFRRAIMDVLEDYVSYTNSWRQFSIFHD